MSTQDFLNARETSASEAAGFDDGDQAQPLLADRTNWKGGGGGSGGGGGDVGSGMATSVKYDTTLDGDSWVLKIGEPNAGAVTAAATIHPTASKEEAFI